MRRRTVSMAAFTLVSAILIALDLAKQPVLEVAYNFALAAPVIGMTAFIVSSTIDILRKRRKT